MEANVDKTAVIQTIMTDFARRTCLSGGDCRPVRYLWTDAFAVCNFISLFRKTGEPYFKEEAVLLVDQVHHILGRHRDDDERSGWISGLDEKEGEKHPTIGGLRIGKKQNERKKDEPYDERAEWEQDGQYYHYLTKWMHALDLTSELTGDRRYRRWALELARTAYEKFSYDTPANSKRMYWKMSIDLSYPLVPSMGQHDALDGYITCLELDYSASKERDLPEELHLERALSGLRLMAQSINWESDDPLGIGGLLADASILAQLIVESQKAGLSDFLFKMLYNALKGIKAFMQTETLRYPAQYRLAFREFGLSIGLHGIAKIEKLISQHTGYFEEPAKLQALLQELKAYHPLCDYIEKFWMEGENQKSPTWREHLDINSVMLATSLDPDGYLHLPGFHE